MTKQLTNEAFVNRLMRFSKYGAMSQLFIIDAITKAANEASKADPKELEAASGVWTFINPHSWVGVAKEIKEALDKNYGENPDGLV